MAKEMQIAFEGPMLAELAEQLAAELGTGKREGKVFNKHMLQALKEAMKPGVAALKAATPRGPTGNLKKSVEIITRNYRKDRNWFAAVGYSASGSKETKIGKDNRRRGRELGYHQGLVEFGTGRRQFGKWTGSTVRIGSSISLTPSLKVTNLKRTGDLRTTPKRPKGFFKSAPIGQTVYTAPMPAQKNIPKVHAKVQGQMQSNLAEDMKTRVGKAVRDLAQWNKKQPL